MRTLAKVSPATGLIAACVACLGLALAVVTGHAAPRVNQAPPRVLPQMEEDPAPARPVWYVDRETMIREIVALWSLWMDDDGAPAGDARRAMLPRYAGYLADAVRLYQDHETDIGGRLPQDPDTHLVLAVMLAKESSLRPTVVGKKRAEIGLGQMHGVSIRPYSRATVRGNPPLQVLLHARWIAYSRHVCGLDDGDADWSDRDWGRTLSMYAGGDKHTLRPDGTCRIFTPMADRVAAVRLYRPRIAALLDAGRP